MMQDASDAKPNDALATRLDQLAGFRTHLPFSQLFCRLIAAWSWEAGEEARDLRQGCLRFLDAELWYHQTLAQLSERENVTYEDLRSVADKRRINLTALSEALEETPASASRANVVRHLLLAECHYHLRETQSTVRELEAAIESGGGHPIVHFALGYNRFDQARELYALSQTAEGRDAQRLEGAFRQACLNAVEAFRDGLTGQVFDAQLHFWIGRALAAAGQTQEAEAALETAAKIDPSIFDRRPFADEPEEAPEAEMAAVADGEADYETPERGPITEEEVRSVGDLLKQRWRVDEVLGESH